MRGTISIDYDPRIEGEDSILRARKPHRKVPQPSNFAMKADMFLRT